MARRLKSGLLRASRTATLARIIPNTETAGPRRNTIGSDPVSSLGSEERSTKRCKGSGAVTPHASQMINHSMYVRFRISRTVPSGTPPIFSLALREQLLQDLLDPGPDRVPVRVGRFGN